jgi:hypothetical protein
LRIQALWIVYWWDMASMAILGYKNAMEDSEIGSVPSIGNVKTVTALTEPATSAEIHAQTRIQRTRNASATIRAQQKFGRHRQTPDRPAK